MIGKKNRKYSLISNNFHAINQTVLSTICFQTRMLFFNSSHGHSLFRFQTWNTCTEWISNEHFISILCIGHTLKEPVGKHCLDKAFGRSEDAPRFVELLKVNIWFDLFLILPWHLWILKHLHLKHYITWGRIILYNRCYIAEVINCWKSINLFVQVFKSREQYLILSQSYCLSKNVQDILFRW